VVGVVIGVGFGFVHGSRHAATLPTPPTRPDATWPAGAKRAPDFGLVDERGAPISLHRFRGRPVVVTFIDPVCRNLCPLEAKVLNQAVEASPAQRPAIVAVSVNPWADSSANFRQDARKWHLVPQWHWAAGRYPQLAAVWRRYAIGVSVKKKVIAGISVPQVAHTEASIIVDPAGFQRALFLFPFRAQQVARTLRQLAGAGS
jgi:protein SCO1/2